MIKIYKVNKTYISAEDIEKPLYQFLTKESSLAVMEQINRILSCSDNLFFRLLDELLFEMKEYSALKHFYTLKDSDLQKSYLISLLNHMYDVAESDTIEAFSKEETLIFHLINALETDTDYISSLDKDIDRLTKILEETYHFAPSTSKRLASRILLPKERNILPTETDNMFFQNTDALSFKNAPKRVSPYAERVTPVIKKKTKNSSPKKAAATEKDTQTKTDKKEVPTDHAKILSPNPKETRKKENLLTEPKVERKKEEQKEKVLRGTGVSTNTKDKKKPSGKGSNTTKEPTHTYTQLSLFDLFDE